MIFARESSGDDAFGRERKRGKERWWRLYVGEEAQRETMGTTTKQDEEVNTATQDDICIHHIILYPLAPSMKGYTLYIGEERRLFMLGKVHLFNSWRRSDLL